MGDARAILDHSVAARDVLASWMSPGDALPRHCEDGDEPRRSTREHNALRPPRQISTRAISFCRVGSRRAFDVGGAAKAANVRRGGILRAATSFPPTNDAATAGETGRASPLWSNGRRARWSRAKAVHPPSTTMEAIDDATGNLPGNPVERGDVGGAASARPRRRSLSRRHPDAGAPSIMTTTPRPHPWRS